MLISALLWVVAAFFLLLALVYVGQAPLAALIAIVTSALIVLAGPNPGNLRARLRIPQTRSATIALSVGAVVAFFLMGAALPSSTSESTVYMNSTSTTADPTPAPQRPTPVPRKADAQYLDPRQLVANPSGYVGQNIWLQGMALNVEHYDDGQDLFGIEPERTWVQFLAQVRGRNTTESVVVEFHPKDTEILKDECYRMYGIVVGSQTVHFVFTGSPHEVPLIRGYDWEPVKRQSFGCADLR